MLYPKPRRQRAQDNTLLSFPVGTRPCLQNSLSCVSKHRGSSSLFSTTTSQLTESTDLSFQLVTPLHLPSAVGQKVSLLHSLPLLLARTSMAAVSLNAWQRPVKPRVVQIRGWHFALAQMPAGRMGPLSGEAPQKQRKTQFLQINGSQEMLMP